MNGARAPGFVVHWDVMINGQRLWWCYCDGASRGSDPARIDCRGTGDVWLPVGAPVGPFQPRYDDGP